MLTSQRLLCVNCFTSLVSFTGSYTEYEQEVRSNTKNSVSSQHIDDRQKYFPKNRFISSLIGFWYVINTLSRVRQKHMKIGRRPYTSLESHSKHLFPSTGCGVWQYLQTGQLNKTRRKYRLTNSTELVPNEPFATLSWFPTVYSYLTLVLKKPTARFSISNDLARFRDFTFEIGVALGMSLSKW